MIWAVQPSSPSMCSSVSVVIYPLDVLISSRRRRGGIQAHVGMRECVHTNVAPARQRLGEDVGIREHVAADEEMCGCLVVLL